MIKYINSVLIFLALILFGYILYIKFFRYTNSLPNFTYTQVKNNAQFSFKDIPKNKETIIMYVSTVCGGCDNTILKVNRNIDTKKNYILITSEKEMEKSKQFFNKFSLHPKIIILNDKNNNFIKDFDLGLSITYPTIFYFSTKNELIKISNTY